MPTTLKIPTAGLFRAVGDNGDAVYSFDANGVPTAYSIRDPNAARGNDYNKNFSYLSSYGVDFNSLPTFNKADIDQQLLRQGKVGANGMPIYNSGGGLADLANLKGIAPTTMDKVVNNDPALAGYVNPNAGFQSTGVIPQPAKTATVSPATAQPLAVNSGGIDYTKSPNETIDQYNARIAAGNPNLPAPKQSSIGNPITPPTAGGGATPTFSTPGGANTADTYTQSLMTQIENMRASLEAENTKRTTENQAKIDALDKKQADLQSLQDLGMSDLKGTVASETAAKQAQLDLEKQRFDENYNASQSLINEMDGLLTTGNQVIQQMKDTTGLASIMEPRIAKTMSDVAARAGVIQAVLAARSGQMGQAQNQLKSATDAISSIYTDQINYYKTLQDFYSNAKTKNAAQLVTLNADQKGYLDFKLKTLADDLKRTQDAADIISNAMMDPDTALAYGQAGVTLNDTTQQIMGKLAVYAYSKEVSDNSNEMAKAGYSSSPISGGTPVTTTDSKGVQKTWWKPQGGFTIGDTRYDAAGNPIASNPKDPSALSTAGADAADAAALMADPTHPLDPTVAKRRFLEKHPTSSAFWDSYFTDDKTKLIKYPKPAAAPAATAQPAATTVSPAIPQATWNPLTWF